MLTKIFSAILVAMFFIGVFFPEINTKAAVNSSSEWWTLFTYPFVHANPFHLLINLVVFWSFGQVLESAVGRRELPQVVFVAGIVTVLPYWIFPFSETSVVGFSGVVYFVFAAFTGFFPYISVSLFFIKTSIPVRIVFFSLLGAEIGMLVVNFFLDFSSVAHLSHLIGLCLGLCYAFIKRRDYKYIDFAKR